MAAPRLGLPGLGTADEPLGTPVQRTVARVHREPPAVSRYRKRRGQRAPVIMCAAPVPAPWRGRWPVAGTRAVGRAASAGLIAAGSGEILRAFVFEVVFGMSFVVAFDDKFGAKFTRTAQLLIVVRRPYELAENVADGAGDDRACHHAGGRVGDDGVDGEGRDGAEAVGSEGCGDQAPPLLAVVRGHLNSHGQTLVWNLVGSDQEGRPGRNSPRSDPLREYRSGLLSGVSARLRIQLETRLVRTERGSANSRTPAGGPWATGTSARAT